MSTKIAIFEAFIILILFGVLYVQHDLLKDKERGHAAAQSARLLEIDHKTREIAVRDGQILAMQKAMDSAAQIHGKIQGVLVGQISGLKRGLVPTQILEKADTSKVVLIAQLEKRDSVIQKQDSLVEDLTEERNAIQHDCKQLTDSLLANVGDLKTVADLWKQNADESERKAQVSEKRIRGWKVLAAVLAGIIVYEEIK